MTRTPAHELPELSDVRSITPAQIEAFRSRGHTHIPGLADAREIAVYEPVITETASRLNGETRPLAERDELGQAFLQTINLWRHHAAVRRFVLARRFASVAAQLLGVERIRLYLDQTFYKEPGGGPTPWHRDNDYMLELAPDQKITLWMPLMDLPDEMGSLSFLTGTHLQPQLTLRQAVRQNIPVDTYGPLKAGDATFHYGDTLHYAPPNNTQLLRKAITITYYVDGAHIVDPGDHEARQKHLADYFPSSAPGDVAETELNPLVCDLATNTPSSTM